MRLSLTLDSCVLYPARGCVDLLRTRRILRGVNSCETYERQQNSANSQILWRANELEAWIGMHYGVLKGRKQTGHKKPQVPCSTRMRNGAECAGKLMRMRSLHQRSGGCVGYDWPAKLQRSRPLYCTTDSSIGYCTTTTLQYPSRIGYIACKL